MGSKLNRNININIEIPEETIQEVFDVIYSSSNCIDYWADDIREFYAKDGSFSYMMFKDSEGDDSTKWLYLTKQGIVNAIALAIENNYMAISKIENIDIVLSDIIAQFAVFGEVLYS